MIWDDFDIKIFIRLKKKCKSLCGLKSNRTSYTEYYKDPTLKKGLKRNIFITKLYKKKWMQQTKDQTVNLTMNLYQ